MSRVMFHMTVVVENFKSLLKEQIRDVRQKDNVKLSDIDVEIKEDDSLIVKAMKADLTKRNADRNSKVGALAIDLVETCVNKENEILERVRELRRQAKELTVLAEELYNARYYLLETGDTIPLGKAMGIIDSVDSKVVDKYLGKFKVPNYLKQQKEKQKDDKQSNNT